MYFFSKDEITGALRRSTNLEIHGIQESPYSPEEITRTPHLDYNSFYDRAINGEFCIIQHIRTELSKDLQHIGKFRFGDDKGKLCRTEADTHPLMKKLDDDFQRLSSTFSDQHNITFHRIAGEWFLCPIPAHLPASCKPENGKTIAPLRGEFHRRITRETIQKVDDLFACSGTAEQQIQNTSTEESNKDEEMYISSHNRTQFQPEFQPIEPSLNPCFEAYNRFNFGSYNSPRPQSSLNSKHHGRKYSPKVLETYLKKSPQSP